MIAALFVETGGAYSAVPGVEPWDEARDARLYPGFHSVVAHPPCQRWGRFWHGCPRKPHQFKLGDDGGCFAAALRAVRTYGGVLEHPADSHAWDCYDLPKPKRGAGWLASPLRSGEWSCYVEQANYGHPARKPTWLFYVGRNAPPELDWSRAEQRLPAYAVERYGYAKARRIGVMAAIGGPRCPICRGWERITARKRGFYRCNACKVDFTVRTGTIFERSHVPLHKWIYAMYLVVTARKGISSMQLAKEIGVTQKTAWFILGRLREACKDSEMEKLRGLIELDETFVGGLEANKHEPKKRRQGRGPVGKTAVLGMRERGGRTRGLVIDNRYLA